MSEVEEAEDDGMGEVEEAKTVEEEVTMVKVGGVGRSSWKTICRKSKDWKA